MIILPRQTAKRLFELAYLRRANPSDVLAELVNRAHLEATKSKAISDLPALELDQLETDRAGDAHPTCRGCGND